MDQVTDLEKDLLFTIEHWETFWEIVDEIDPNLLFELRYEREMGRRIRSIEEVAEYVGAKPERIRHDYAKLIRLLRAPQRFYRWGGRILGVDERV